MMLGHKCRRQVWQDLKGVGQNDPGLMRRQRHRRLGLGLKALWGLFVKHISHTKALIFNVAFIYDLTREKQVEVEQLWSKN